MDIDEFETLLDELEPLRIDERETTVFDVGARGYYENPTSDLLAFFLDPNAAHTLGSLVLDALVDALSPDDWPAVLEMVGSPMREIATSNRKRIDLILQFREHVVVIENKIYHWLANDLKEYERHIASPEGFGS